MFVAIGWLRFARDLANRAFSRLALEGKSKSRHKPFAVSVILGEVAPLMLANQSPPPILRSYGSSVPPSPD
jgi:hypothetical protein